MGTPLDTTVDTDDSAERAPADLRWALLWVFPEVSETMLEVGRGPWRIGRSPRCQIPISDHAASREHAEIVNRGPLVLVRDLDSTNGTFINGTQIEQVPVRTGSILRIGQWVGMFCKVAPDAERESVFFQELLPSYHAGPSLRRALDAARRTAKSQLPILIEGATGTGKEGVALYVHRHSDRRGPFHAINCAAIPAEMAESQLFGHKRGAFTGAREGSLGHFRAAEAGTLFLDEIAELPLPLQAKLLRALQERKVTPLGDTVAVATDVRIIAACQEPLEAAVARETFRADLLARLSGLVVRVPRLAERIEDVPHLFQQFLATHSGNLAPGVDGKLVERLCLYDWPSNVRELELLARQLLIVHGHERQLKRVHLPTPIRDAGSRLEPSSGERPRQALERFVEALHDTRGNVTQAAARLGISRARAYRLMAGTSIDSLLARYPRRSPQRLADPTD